MITLYGKLVAKQKEYGGYTTYVFENEQPDSLFSRYITCTRYPNWDEHEPEYNKLGFISLDEHVAGKDSWYDGKEKVMYKYDHIQFIKFVPEPSSDTKDNIITL